ncbi:hypothetical protein SK128_017463 [Halocaridina rubra]|uniref:Uncharacterized protein n=1 Tax=Halocaridina rubra TaxID=373956 RepID=A0AAN8WNF9_HALRR
MKVESEDTDDDTSMNGIELFCRDAADVGHDNLPPDRIHGNSPLHPPSSSGETVKRECGTGYLTGLRMKSEEDQGFWVDDTAANDLEMQSD